MAQRSHVPKFGNWDSGDNVPYTAYFDKARKGRTGAKIINPNDPEENSDLGLDNPSSEHLPPPKPRVSSEDPSGKGSLHLEDDPKPFIDSPARHDNASNRSGSRSHGVPPADNRRRPSMQSAGSEHSIDRSPLHRQARPPGRDSPLWEPKNSYDNIQGTPGRSRLRQANRGDETPDKGAAVPKFGDWDVNNPAQPLSPLHVSHFYPFSGTMREEVVLSVVDPLLIASSPLQPQHGGDAGDSLIEGATHVNDVGECDTLEEQAQEQEQEQEKDLTLMVECRICQEDDTLQNLDIPCACKGTLKFAHRECVQLWCYEKGDTICEICHQPFKPGYSVTTTVIHPGDTSIDISDDWASYNFPLDLHNSRLLAIAAVEHQVPETGEDYAYAAGTGGITLWHSVGLILMALLLLRHVAPLFNADVEKALTYFYFFFLRAAAVVLPCYLMAWIIRVILHQRQRQQAPEELAFVLQADEQG